MHPRQQEPLSFVFTDAVHTLFAITKSISVPGLYNQQLLFHAVPLSAPNACTCSYPLVPAVSVLGQQFPGPWKVLLSGPNARSKTLSLARASNVSNFKRQCAPGCIVYWDGYWLPGYSYSNCLIRNIPDISLVICM